MDLCREGRPQSVYLMTWYNVYITFIANLCWLCSGEPAVLGIIVQSLSLAWNCAVKVDPRSTLRNVL